MDDLKLNIHKLLVYKHTAAVCEIPNTFKSKQTIETKKNDTTNATVTSAQR